jgi:hypothetical protein
MTAFSRMATVTASTKRTVASAGKITAPTTNLASLQVTPLYPVDPEIKQRLALNTPHELLQCFTEGAPDVKEGDVLVVAGIDYPIKSVADWAGLSGSYKLMVVENLKK